MQSLNTFDQLPKNITESTIALIEQFRLCCIDGNLVEIPRKNLVSHHDTSIRFTNSTTSVLKPYLQNPEMFTVLKNDGVFLIQPAMGQQGIQYWQKSHTFGAFPSSFISLGMLLPFKMINKCMNLSLSFIEKCLPENRNLRLYYTSQVSEFEVLLNDPNVSSFLYLENLPINSNYIHKYGMDGYIGKDIIFGIEQSEKYYKFGNFSIIEKLGVPIAVEFSLDLPLLLAAISGLHPVCYLCAADAIKSVIPTMQINDQGIALCDFMTLCCELVLNGLIPGARGRRRNLRNIRNEMLILISNLGIPNDQFRRMIDQTVSNQYLIQNKFYSDSSQMCYFKPNIVFDKLMHNCSVNV